MAEHAQCGAAKVGPGLHDLAGFVCFVCFVCYMDNSSGKAWALSHRERALELQPGHPRAGLYRTHSLHDLERRAEAAAAYAAIERADFGEGKAWRGELAREQRGYCVGEEAPKALIRGAVALNESSAG